MLHRFGLKNLRDNAMSAEPERCTVLRSAIVSGAMAVAAGACVLACTASAAQDAIVPGWRVAAQVALKSGTATVDAVTALNGADAWAAGSTETSGGKAAALIEHWAGRSWRRVGLPAKASAEWRHALLRSVLAASPGNGLWVFGTDVIGGKADEYARYSGNRWRFGTLPDTAPGKTANRALVLIAAAAAVSESQAWAFGTTLTTSGDAVPYAAQYTGHSWVTTRVPGSGAIVAVVVISPRDVLALVGSDEFVGFGTSTPTVVRWNGSSWRPLPVQPKGLPADDNATSMAVTDGHVWISGDYYATISTRGVFSAELTRSGWKITDLPHSMTSDDFAIASLVPDGRGGLWALGVSYQDGALVSQRLWHYAGGRWRAPIEPTFGGSRGELMQLTAVPGVDTLWGVGSVAHKSSLNGLIAVEGPTPS
jgi:hypothetical protein